jgi:Transcriptional regulator, AbiEi antitoxin/Protein of unknown function (DUF559)
MLARMTMNQRRLTALATGQLGAFTREQARAAGYSDFQLRHRVQSGVLDQIGPNAYRLPSVDPSMAALLHGLLLDIGGRVWVTGPTGAALYGADGFELTPPFHVTIQRGRDVQRVGHTIHTSKMLAEDDQTERHGFPTFKPERLLLDIARIETSERLMVAIESMLRDRWVTELGLRRRIAGLSPIARANATKLLAALDEVGRKLGAHSFLERAFLELVERAGLTRPDCQQVLARGGDRVVRVDFRFPGTELVVEVMGYRFHRDKKDLQRDVERMNALVLSGFVVVQFTYEDVVEDPERVLTTLGRLGVSADAR